MSDYAASMAGDLPPRRPRSPEDTALTPPTDRSAMRMGTLAYRQIKEQLLEGRWAAGERLSVEMFKSALGVSKQPVMEALRRLSADGLVEIVPQVGCRVTSYGPQDVADFFTLFGAFEGAISAVAAQRRTPADLAVLDEVHARVGHLCGERDAAVRAHGYREFNREFHGIIHRMARSDMVEEMSLRMWDLSDFLINTAGPPQPLSGALDERHADHEEIRQALVAGDADRARAATERHIVGTVELIRSGARGDATEAAGR
ncbi:GntR family transcriptional regulator [Geodermatophilus ruber]|uniref:Transcriptional regulator, GntR family n=1 Tax=Geodermatophilus ruber TaxID=504800 RepID=A0A1I4HCF0_9ACTN|nr:GntR family transcriptional regulator [Geodermatophilus ruber]SFL39450.1 transcriptional regulator, GntR family [Geodermatophilus ruber]